MHGEGKIFWGSQTIHSILQAMLLQNIFGFTKPFTLYYKPCYCKFFKKAIALSQLWVSLWCYHLLALCTFFCTVMADPCCDYYRCRSKCTNPRRKQQNAQSLEESNTKEKKGQKQIFDRLNLLIEWGKWHADLSLTMLFQCAATSASQNYYLVAHNHLGQTKLASNPNLYSCSAGFSSFPNMDHTWC